MGMDFYLDIIRKTLTQALIVVTPMLGVAIVVGLTISIVQSATSIQEQSLSFIPKLLCTAAGIFFLMPWMMREMASFFYYIMSLFPVLAQ